MNNKNLKITVVGIGSGAQNIIDYLFLNNKSENIEFALINSDKNFLEQAKIESKLLIHGDNEKFYGLGCGGDASIGKQYAEFCLEKIEQLFTDTDVAFLISCFGGGCGTGATPVIAEMLKNKGIKTIAIITKPFAFESPSRFEIATSEIKISISHKFPDRMERATEGIKKLQSYVEKYIVVDNQSLLENFQHSVTLAEIWNYVNKKVAEEFYRAL